MALMTTALWEAIIASLETHRFNYLPPGKEFTALLVTSLYVRNRRIKRLRVLYERSVKRFWYSFPQMITITLVSKDDDYIKGVYDVARWQNDMSFIRHRLSEKEKHAADKLVEQFENSLESMLLEIMGSGYKVSIVWSDESQSFFFTVIGGKDHKKNPNKSHTSQHDDLITVVGYALYKNAVLWDNDVWDEGAGQSDFG